MFYLITTYFIFPTTNTGTMVQTLITKFFRPAKIAPSLKASVRERRKIHPDMPKPHVRKNPPSSSVARYEIPARRKASMKTQKSTLVSSEKKEKVRTSKKTAQKKDTLTPKKPDTAKKPSPQNKAILDHLKKNLSPKFYFNNHERPHFKSLFPSTTRPAIRMFSGQPRVDKDVFNSLLSSRLNAAHTVLKAARLDRPRLPKEFVSSQIALINYSFVAGEKARAEKKGKKEERKVKAQTPKTTASIEFVASSRPSPQQLLAMASGPPAPSNTTKQDHQIRDLRSRLTALKIVLDAWTNRTRPELIVRFATSKYQEFELPEFVRWGPNDRQTLHQFAAHFKERLHPGDSSYLTADAMLVYNCASFPHFVSARIASLTLEADFGFHEAMSLL